MKNSVIYICLCLATGTLLAQQVIFENPLSPRIANYSIDVRLDTEEQKLYGQEILRWENPSADTIWSLPFHLYLNAFKNSRSTFMIESAGSRRGTLPDSRGWIEINGITDRKGKSLNSSLEFIHPDDDNEDDRTVVQLNLEEPVMPHQNIELNINFTAKLPEVRTRTGYGGDFYFVAQWFPKIGVYEPAGMRYATKGQWNCHQFHAWSEFYADFGVYEVSITVPSDFVVGATGVLLQKEQRADSTTYFYQAEDVIDFTWTTSPQFVEKNDQWKEVSISVLSHPEHLVMADRQIKALKQAMEYYEYYLGPYPYPTLTVVFPPLKGIGASGMEYPSLITTGGLYNIPEWLRLIEIVTIHEFGHQYFMAMVATNEFEEPWMDEGITTYYESRIIDHFYGPKHSTVDFLGFHYGGMESHRVGYLSMPNPKIASNALASWEFPEGAYGPITYAKSSTWLRTLEGLVGIETMDAIMKTFFERWKFRHPSGRDFIEVVNEVVRKNHGQRFGENMDWFFDQVLYGTAMCDYQVASISNRPVSAPTGMDYFESKVVLHRLGEITLPAEVLIHFENGDRIVKYWDGKARSYEFSFRSSVRVDWAVIDPDHKIYLDKNFINNSYTLKGEKAGIWKYVGMFFLWLQNVLQTAGFLV